MAKISNSFKGMIGKAVGRVMRRWLSAFQGSETRYRRRVKR